MSEPSVIPQEGAFNSFEDETFNMVIINLKGQNDLSIPLRMKREI